MKKLKILTDPNPLLRKSTDTIDTFDGELQNLIDNLIYTMRNSDGIGLAAPQVGELKKIIVVEFETEDKSSDEFPLTVIVNPKIVEKSEKESLMMEGCLSFPGKEIYIKRPEKIKISGFDRWGKKLDITCDNLFSRVLQHEIDHLNGVLMIDYIKPVRTIFIGNGSLGVPILERIKSDPQFEFLSAVTKNDSLGGRDNKNIQTDIASICEKLKLPVQKIDNVNSPNFISKISQLKPELVIVADFNQILSEKIIKLPKYGILNVHPSLLPKFRGPSPIVSALLSGDKKTGISIIKINNKIDAGKILSQIEVKIKKTDTAESLKESLSIIGAILLMETIPYYLAGEVIPTAQNESLAINTKKIKKIDGEIKGNESDDQIERMVRAFCPWPGVYQIINGKKIFITKAHLDSNHKIIIDKVKPEGKNEMGYIDFQNGYKIKLLKTFDNK